MSGVRRSVACLILMRTVRGCSSGWATCAAPRLAAHAPTPTPAALPSSPEDD